MQHAGKWQPRWVAKAKVLHNRMADRRQNGPSQSSLTCPPHALPEGPDSLLRPQVLQHTLYPHAFPLRKRRLLGDLETSKDVNDGAGQEFASRHRTRAQGGSLLDFDCLKLPSCMALWQVCRSVRCRFTWARDDRTLGAARCEIIQRSWKCTIESVNVNADQECALGGAGHAALRRSASRPSMPSTCMQARAAHGL